MSMSFTQVCSCCGKDKELIPENYYRSKVTANGFHHECRECYVPKWKERNKEVDWSEPFPSWVTAFAESKKIHYAKSPKKIEKLAKRNENLLKGVKECNTCHETKELSEFADNKKNKDRKDNTCKLCKAAYRKRRYLAQKQDNIVKETNDNRDSCST